MDNFDAEGGVLVHAQGCRVSCASRSPINPISPAVPTKCLSVASLEMLSSRRVREATTRGHWVSVASALMKDASTHCVSMESVSLSSHTSLPLANSSYEAGIDSSPIRSIVMSYKRIPSNVASAGVGTTCSPAEQRS